MTDLTPNHPAVKAGCQAAGEWTEGASVDAQDHIALALHMTAACITAAIPHLTADDLRNTDAAEEIREIHCAKEGSQFRSRDIFPPAFGLIARGDYTHLGADIRAQVPDFPKDVVCYTDGYGNMKCSIDPARLNVGLKYDTPRWSARLDLTHYAAKKTGDIDGASLVTPPAAQFTTPSATTLDLSGQWRIRKDLRLNAGIYNLTDKKYWNWADVRGVASTSNVLDAYTQPGRNVRVSLVADF